jgi:hypothetical protein
LATEETSTGVGCAGTSEKSTRRLLLVLLIVLTESTKQATSSRLGLCLSLVVLPETSTSVPEETTASVGSGVVCTESRGSSRCATLAEEPSTCVGLTKSIASIGSAATERRRRGRRASEEAASRLRLIVVVAKKATSSIGGGTKATSAAKATSRSSVGRAATKETTSRACRGGGGRRSKQTTSRWLVLTEETSTRGVVRATKCSTSALAEPRCGVGVGAATEKASASIRVRVRTKG